MFSYEIPLPLDALIAATFETLPGYAPGFVDFSFEERPGIGVFHLSQSELGMLGDLKIRKIGNNVSEISFSRKNYFPEEEAIGYYKRYNPNKYKELEIKKQENFLEYKKQIRAISNDFSKKKEQHIHLIFRAYFSRLVNERIWTHYGVEIPKYLLSFAGKALDVNQPAKNQSKPVTHIRKNKKGQGKFTDMQKLEALIEWDRMDQGKMYLVDFLDMKFGNEGGTLIVPTSTFHGWRRHLRAKGLYKPTEKGIDNP